MFEEARDQANELTTQAIDYSREHPWIAAGVGVGVLITGHWLLKPSRKRDYKRKPTTSELSGGGISKGKVKEIYSDYYDAYGKGEGEGIKERSRTTGIASPILFSRASRSMRQLHRPFYCCAFLLLTSRASS